jgi:hypothetical protein
MATEAGYAGKGRERLKLGEEAGPRDVLGRARVDGEVGLAESTGDKRELADRVDGLGDLPGPDDVAVASLQATRTHGSPLPPCRWLAKPMDGICGCGHRQPERQAREERMA